MLEDGGCVGIQMLADAEVVGGGGEELGEEGFALEEREVAEVVAVEVQEVEDEVGEGVLVAILKRGLEVGKACVPVGGEDDDLAVEECGLGGERFEGLGEGLHAVSPVEAAACEELDFGALFASLDAVAVELELVDPAGGFGGGGGGVGQLRGDEGGQGFFRGLGEVWGEGIGGSRPWR